MAANTTGFSGHLSIVPLKDVLQKLRAAKETGVLSFFTPMARATVTLVEGRVTAAEMGVRRGTAALDVLWILNEGAFTFSSENAQDAQARDSTIPEDFAETWVAKEKRALELVGRLPALCEVVRWDEQVVSRAKAALPEDAQALAGLVSGKTLLETLVESQRDLLEVLETLHGAHSEQKRTSAQPLKPGASFSKTIVQMAPVDVQPRAPALPSMTGVKARRVVWGEARGDSGAAPRAGAEPGPAADHSPPRPNAFSRTLLGGMLPLEPALEGSQKAASRSAKAPFRRTQIGIPVDHPSSAGQDSSLAIGQILDLGHNRADETPIPRTIPASELGLESPPPSSQGDLPSITLDGRSMVRLDTLAEGPSYSIVLVREYRREIEPEMALKMPNVPSASVFAALENEGAILGKLSHRNWLGLVQAGRDSETPYLLTWYQPGVSLAKLLEASASVPSECYLAVVRQVVQALIALHDPTRPQGGVVHCNVCPENVLVGFDGVVRLTGLSNALPTKRRAGGGDLRVHAQFAPPELLRGDRVDARSDVYSVGQLLLLWLRGNAASDAQRTRVLLLAERAAASEPSERFASAGDLLAALDELGCEWRSAQISEWLAVERDKPKSDPAQLSPAIVKKSWRTSWWMWAGLAAIVLLAVVLVITLNKGSK